MKRFGSGRQKCGSFISIIILGSAVVGCSDGPVPTAIDKFCVSESGQSKFWLTLNTTERRGAIRYRFMGQDIAYAVKTMSVDGGTVRGRADFRASATGETRGTPIAFSYDSAADTLKDGHTLAKCQNSELGTP